MHILITNVKDYNLFCEECEPKGIAWQTGHKFTDRNAPVYKNVIRHLSSGESIIIKIHPDNRCSWTEEGESSYFNYIIEKGDYIEYNPAKIVVIVA